MVQDYSCDTHGISATCKDAADVVWVESWEGKV